MDDPGPRGGPGDLARSLRVLGCPRPTTPASARCWLRRWRRSAARSGRARSRWRRRSRTAMESGEHLLVQAGTGTGKSLGYLVPAILHADRVVVATATLALQHQLVERDIPALIEAAKGVLDGGSVVRRAEGALELRLPAPDPRGRARRPGRAGGACPRGRTGAEVAGDAGMGGGGGQGRRHRRARPRAPAHRPDLAAGLGVAPRVPGRREVPVRRRVLRRAGARAGDARPRWW